MLAKLGHCCQPMSPNSFLKLEDVLETVSHSHVPRIASCTHISRAGPCPWEMRATPLPCALHRSGLTPTASW